MTVSTEIVNGLAKALHTVKAYPVYVDFPRNDMQFPCWRIKLTDDATDTLMVGDRYQQEYNFDIWMILNEDAEITDVRGQVVNLAETLCYALEVITLADGSKIRGSNIRWRITDGILHFFVTYAPFVRRVKDKVEVMKKLDLTGKPKG